MLKQVGLKSPRNHIDSTYNKLPSRSYKKYNNLLFVFIACSIGFTIGKVYLGLITMESSFIPRYMVILANGQLINAVLIALIGIIPALFLRIQKQYRISNYCLISFIVIGLITQTLHELYTVFYSIV